MGLLLRGKGSSAADVLTTEHDTLLAIAVIVGKRGT